MDVRPILRPQRDGAAFRAIPGPATISGLRSRQSSNPDGHFSTSPKSPRYSPSWANRHGHPTFEKFDGSPDRRFVGC